MSVKFNLYGTLGCHLCDDALALCQAQMPAEDISVIDIMHRRTPNQNVVGIAENRKNDFSW